MDEYLNLLQTHQQEAPVNVVELAFDLGIKVWKSDQLGSQISGKLLKDRQHGGKSGFAIFVNAAHAETRQRFTIAHEIAHFMLHRDAIKDGIAEDVFHRSELLSNKQEVEANKLAANILMPFSLLSEVQKNYAVDDVEGLAKAFHVSTAAMSIRLGIQG